MASSGDPIAVRREAPCVGARIVGHVDGAFEGPFGRVTPAEGVEQERPADVGGGEVGPLGDDGVINGEGRPIATCPEEQGRETEAQAQGVGVSGDAFPEGALGAGRVPRVVAGQTEGVPGLRVGRGQLDRTAEGADGRLGLPPAQKTRAEHTVGPRRAGCDPRRLLVGETCLVVVALKLPREADVDAGLGVVGAERGQPLEGLTGRAEEVGSHLRLTELPEALGVLRFIARRLPEGVDRVEVRSVVHGAPPPRDGRGHAARGEHRQRRQGEEPEGRLTCPRPDGNMPPMDRKTLAEILSHAPGIEHAKSRYEVAEDHRVTFYLGQLGRAMAVGEVAACVLDDAFIEIILREDGATLWVDYDTVTAVADRTSRPAAERRPGFG